MLYIIRDLYETCRSRFSNIIFLDNDMNLILRIIKKIYDIYQIIYSLYIWYFIKKNHYQLQKRNHHTKNIKDFHIII